MIFLVILLLQVSTSIELQSDGENVTGIIFKGANFIKVFMRLLTLVLLLAAMPIFVQQVQTSLHNGLFSIFYGSLALIALLELLAFTIARVIPKVVAITTSTLHIK